MFIAIDPGKNTGVATFSEKGEDLAKHVFLEDHMKLFLGSLYVSTYPVVFIMEDFKLRKDLAMAQVGSDMPSSRVIGMVQMMDHILGDASEIKFVQPGNLKTALKWAGYSREANMPRSWHCPDDLAAYAHGVMYLIQQKLRPHPIFGAYKEK